MNKNTTDFVLSLTSKTFQKIHNHVDSIEITDSEKSKLAFEIYEAHVNAIVSHMIDVYVNDDYKNNAVDDITNTMNQFVKHFLKVKKERYEEQV